MRCLLLIFMSLATTYGAATIDSPNGNIRLSFEIRDMDGRTDCPVYKITFHGRPIISPSRLGFHLQDGTELASEFRLVSRQTFEKDTTWQPVYGERATVRDHYHGMMVNLVSIKSPADTLKVFFRCYDAGAALCYTLHSHAGRKDISIKNELTEFRLPGDVPAWCVASAQGVYEKKNISAIQTAVERPLTVRINDTTWAAVAEAKLVDYARMKLGRSSINPHTLVSQLDAPVQSPLPLTTPWRVVMIGSSPGQLLENNDIILNLNDPCRLSDTSWIKPGKVIREVTLTTAGGKACVDFAVQHNLQYVEFDAGWYGHEYHDSSDATTITVDPKRSPGPLDLHEVVRYAGERDIGIILYVNRRALERQLDTILPLYQKWGIKGVKYGFVRVGPQKWTTWLHHAVRKAAKHRLMVDIHDEYRPTGYSRTFPNLMTQEGIGGDETRPVNEQTLILLFTRMPAGAADHTICYFDDRVKENASHAYQLAKAVCFYSPWQFLYWYDRPMTSPRKKGGAGGQKNIITGEPELEFFDHVPAVWDDTRVIHGAVGGYAVIARRSGDNWFVGCMNSGRERTLDVPLDFLPAGRDYVAHTYTDDPDVETRTHVAIVQKPVDAKTVLQAAMRAKGGMAVRLCPAEENE